MGTNTNTLKQIATEKDVIARLLLSSNFLGILFINKHTGDKVSIDEYTTLLNGNDKNCYLLEGKIELLYRLIDYCYEARNNNKTILLNINNNNQEIIFS